MIAANGTNQVGHTSICGTSSAKLPRKAALAQTTWSGIPTFTWADWRDIFHKLTQAMLGRLFSDQIMPMALN